MSRTKRNPWWISGLAMLTLVLSACGPERSYSRITPMTSSSMVIYQGMTREYNGLYGILDVYVDPFGFLDRAVTASGQKEQEWAATIWLLIVGQPETYASFQVQSGQSVSFEGYRLKILRIGQDDRGNKFVEIEVIDDGLK
jgi:hypothetical protein